MLRTLTLRRVFGSSQSQLVGLGPYRLKEFHFFLRNSLLPADLELDEEGTRISLTIVDTPGFGDQIDNEARYASGQDSRRKKNALWLISRQLFGDCRIPRAPIRRYSR